MQRGRIQENNIRQVAEIIPEGSKVLDLGCGNGDLLEILIREKKVSGFGVEIDRENVFECIRRGIPVVHGDLDAGLENHTDGKYDYVILSRTLQVVRKPLFVLQEMLRVGKYGIVLSPNFGHWKIRARLLIYGRMPKSRNLPFEWYDTPNIHLFTIKDFRNLCRDKDFTIEKEMWISNSKVRCGKIYGAFANLIAKQGLFIISRENRSNESNQ